MPYFWTVDIPLGPVIFKSNVTNMFLPQADCQLALKKMQTAHIKKIQYSILQTDL